MDILPTPPNWFVWVTGVSSVIGIFLAPYFSGKIADFFRFILDGLAQFGMKYSLWLSRKRADRAVDIIRVGRNPQRMLIMLFFTSVALIVMAMSVSAIIIMQYVHYSHYPDKIISMMTKYGLLSLISNISDENKKEIPEMANLIYNSLFVYINILVTMSLAKYFFTPFKDINLYAILVKSRIQKALAKSNADQAIVDEIIGKIDAAMQNNSGASQSTSP